MDFESGLLAYRQQVDNRLDAILPPISVDPSTLYQAMRHSVLAPGKRLRPILCMEFGRLFGGDRDTLVTGGCALELVHCFSLIHDDLPALDNDDLRRGIPTCHKVFGEATAILAGDALFALAFEVVAGLELNPKLVNQMVKVIASACGPNGLVAGEMLDLASEGATPNEALLHNIHQMKTGRLIEAACVVGVLAADGDAPAVQAARSYGQKLGLAFQIADDLLNETATADSIGKSVGSDRDRQKITFPAVYGIKKSQELAQSACQEALAAIALIPGSEMLQRLAIYAIERDR